MARIAERLQSYKDLKIAFTNHAWRAPIAACVLGGLGVLFFNIISCFVLIRCVRACVRVGGLLVLVTTYSSRSGAGSVSATCTSTACWSLGQAGVFTTLPS